ncbi:hypothetical protein N7492_010173 [Penicillium capsulatum]|uniref:FAD-binding domain-containing protein n=1 Tax=Penicillium capsulatum TaxID=69766 RepID=A0A9W9HKW3_9EURO|nr:hypothetical protein N7492_010173 [Penicillium capsulatum]KAJ6112681.1 hypothetical protein N7512_008005 [Penicillium capsulatum]
MPLKVIVVGAGLGGLGAAIALTRAGHDVHVIEQSGFLNEIGAAIHVAPNASRILRKWECDLQMLHSVRCDRMQVWDAAGNLLLTPVVTGKVQAELGITDNWILTHRVDLHNTLRATAAKPVNGKRATIQLSSRVASVDADAGVVTLEDGTIHTGDLIIGADGTHSRAVECIAGEDQEKESTGQNCYRFLIPVSKMQVNPLTASLLEKIGMDAHAFTSEDRRLVIYPCRRGELLNVAGLHPSGKEMASINSSWLNTGSKEDLLQTYESYSPELREMCRIAEDIKLWSLGSRNPPRTFVKGKLALMGDAAHPTLPHQGQGGAQALEDAAALGALFPSDTTVEQVHRRLEMYNRIRYDHAVTVMMMSQKETNKRAEMMDKLRMYVPHAELPESMVSFCWSSKPDLEAQRLLEAEVQA